MRTLAVGDIHGCDLALMKLIHEVCPTPDDYMVFLGDYIDRGPESKKVIEKLSVIERLCSVVFLRGNHEVMILEAREEALKANLWLSYGGFETLTSYSAEYETAWSSAIPDSHWKFLERTIPFYETETHIFVHACLDPDLDMHKQPPWLLYWESFDRIRPHKSRKKIVCGHTPQHSGQIQNLGFATCINTGAVTGGWLTCLDVDSGEFWQSNESGSVRKGVLNSSS